MENEQSTDNPTRSGNAPYLKLNITNSYITGFNNNAHGNQHVGSCSTYGGQRIGEDHEDGTPNFTLPRIVGAKFQTYKETILEWLMDQRSNTLIGVHGMGGVGKTTLLKQLHDHLNEHTDIAGDVYWVTVSADCTPSQLQGKIAKAFRVGEITEETLDERARKLKARLAKKGRFVLFLDDLWDSYKIEHQVGVPVEANRCKIILSTRREDVCRRMKCGNHIVKVKVLSREDAWELFDHTLGNSQHMMPAVRELAKKVARECKCLPLAIITVATSMIGVLDQYEWEHALNVLRNPDSSHDDMENDVYRQLKFSYERLTQKKNLKRCFLTCIMYGEDVEIRRDELIELWGWEGLLENTGGKEEQVAEGHTILNMLVRSCLLESSNEYWVKMHDLIRQMAVFITKGRFIARAKQQLKEVPEEKHWTQDLINVSLSYNYIKVVPSHMSPDCPNLTILMLNDNFKLRSVPDLFFVHMKALTVIDLSGTSIEKVPESVSGLVNLKAILLCDCSGLKHVPSVAQLTKLEVLDFRGSDEVIAPKGLESLVQLEKLPFCRWEISDLNDFNRMIDSLGYTRFSKYEFRIFRHDLITWINMFDDMDLDEVMNEKAVYIDGVKCIEDHHIRSGVLIPGTVEWLYLVKCDFNGRNLWEVWQNMKCIQNLKGVQITKSKRLKYVVDLDASHAHFIFNHLQRLYLIELPDLENIIKLGRGEIMIESESPIPPPNPLHISTFCNLSQLMIYDCPKLKVVFPAELLVHTPLLPNLGSIEVEKCGELVEIFESHSNTNFTLSLQGVYWFRLRSLPKLEHIFRGLVHAGCEINIEDCPRMELVPLRCDLICDNSVSSLSSIPTCADNPKWWEDFRKKYPPDYDILSGVVSRAHEHVGVGCKRKRDQQ